MDEETNQPEAPAMFRLEAIDGNVNHLMYDRPDGVTEKIGTLLMDEGQGARVLAMLARANDV